MATVYTDGNGTYYQPGNIDAQDSTRQAVNVRDQQTYITVYLPVTTVQSNIGSVWQVAPSLSDIGGGVWSGATLIDPS